MKKIYIITNSSFPFGNANSNYIRYFSLALLSAGWQVSVIGSDMNSGKAESGNYNGIEFQNIKLPSFRFPFHLRDHLFYGSELKKVLSKIKIEKDAYVFVYSMYLDLVKTVFEETKHLEKGHLSMVMVEWFQPFQYRFGRLNPDYQCWKYTFEKLATRYPKVIPISRKLGEFYSQAGCDVLVLPIMADVENNVNDLPPKKFDGIFDFIYPGDANKKDTFDGLLEAIGELSEEEIGRVRFHFTLLSEDNADAMISNKKLDAQKIKKALVFHGRLEYSKLLELYKTVDFLFIPREKNVVTLSNFPSKIPELMCYGVVPVCSRVGDYADLYLSDGTDSIIFDGADKDGCLDGLKRVLSMTEHELDTMKSNAVRCACEKFDYHNWSKKIEEFILG
ncbi:MAG: glycosyltransferase [Clostridia bacterium]|nr:glycosyltransferase [Clostridia bacterium]